MNGIIKIYDFLASRHWVVWCMIGCIVLLLGLCISKLHYQEDIFDFLPQNKEYTESMQVYSSLSEASRIVIIFEGEDADTITQAIDVFAEKCPDAITEIDLDGFVNRLQYMHEHMPYFLTDESYSQLEAICDFSTDTIGKLLRQDKQILSMPGTSFLYSSLSSDPFNLIPIAKGIAGQYAGAQSSFTSYDGYMMTVDQHRGFAFYDSEYGSTETGQNAALIDSLSAMIESINQSFPTLNIRLLGAPVIAVENARRIKTDSTWAIAISVILILALLLYSFPRKRDIFFIFVAVGFGWLVGMAALSVFVGSVSVIVLGIGAILIGISINYPLHILVHQRYTTSIRQTLKEVLSPLITGNITTVGAFMALIPLHSPALRQLGIFASFMLFGTIFFCIFILPHMMSDKPAVIREIRLPFVNKLAHQQKWHSCRKILSCFAIAVFALTAAYIVIKDYPMFDANLSHINYMTTQQREDFAWFERLSPNTDEPAYLAYTAKEELTRRERQWDLFWQTHNADTLAVRLKSESLKAGFREDAFTPFIQIISNPIQKVDLEDTKDLASVWPGKFDTEKMNIGVAQSLTDNFDYIGIVCSVIVLVFLCISFKNIWIGLIAFLPMLLSWVLILALMQIFGLQFNIVNVILATFIFGQGDDYTIFVVEGILNEEKYGKRLLDQYKQSILLSALVMLLAIGVLAFAKHPAMSSLGAVTLIGMVCVVFMAFIVPTMLFKVRKYIKSKKI